MISSFILTGLALIMIIRVGGPRLVLALAVPLGMAIMMVVDDRREVMRRR
jgi:hypothetical protein